MSGQGRFITFEGIDGSGKSTQARLLADHLRDTGHEVVLTREPGGSPGAEDIRKLVLEGDADRWSAETELLLFTAARRDHIEKVISPALGAGKTVICDRYVDSTRMYQGSMRVDLRKIIDYLHDRLIKRDPDLTLLIDMDPAKGLERALSRGNGEERFESQGVNLQARMRNIFKSLAKQYPERIVEIDGNQSVSEVADEVRNAVEARL